MKQSLAPVLYVALAMVLALSVAACGQRVKPAEPAGKIMPSTAH